MSISVSTSQSKINELLDAIRQEFSNVSQEANSYRLQNQKDYDFKINQQLAEMQQIRNTVYELELTHRKMKDAYEEEIARLKLELEQRDRHIANLAASQSGSLPQHVLPTGPPSLPTTGTNTSSNLQKPSIISSPQSLATISQPTNIASQLQKGPIAEPTNQHPLSGSLMSTTSSITMLQPQKQAPPPLQQTTQMQAIGVATNTKLSSGDSTSPDLVTQEHYLVPSNQRSLHAKPIPPFLVDLDSQLVPPNLKKQTNDYYILYNPALPHDLDIDMHLSLDHSSVVCCVRFSQDGEFLATGCNKTTQVYRVSTGELISRLSDESVSVSSINQQDNGSGSGDDPVTQNNSSSDLYIRSVCFSPDGKFLATGAEDKLIRIWDLSSNQIVMTLQGHEQDIYSLDYFPSGDKLVSGSGDRTVRIWDLRTGQCSLTLSIEDGVTTVAVSPGEGKFVAAGSLDRTVRVWDSETGFLVERLDSENELGTGHKDSVYSVVFTRDGQSVVSGSLDRTIKLWDLRGLNSKKKHATCEVTYTGHKDFVLSVATTPNDEYILSGSKDRGVLFWNTQSGNPLLMLQGHRNSVISVSVANSNPLGPDFGVFATGSGDCKARIWKYTKKSNTPKKIQEVQE